METIFYDRMQLAVPNNSLPYLLRANSSHPSLIFFLVKILVSVTIYKFRYQRHTMVMFGELTQSYFESYFLAQENSPPIK